MTLLEKKNEVIDFTAFKINRMATEFNRSGEDLVATTLYEVLDLYQTGAVEVMWEEGMPIPITPKNYNTNESR